MPPLYEKARQLLGTPPILPLFQPIANITRKRSCYPDEKQELLALARRTQMAYDADKRQTIGVVIPNLEGSWHKLRQIFRAVFGVAALGEEERAPFDMSWGERLESHPVIGDLLNILALGSGPQPIYDLLQIFQTAYIRGATEEQMDRCALNNRLIELSARQTHLNVKASLRYKARGPFVECPQLRQSLQDFYQVPGAFKSQASPCHWAQVFGRQAETLGWGAVDNWSSQEIYLQDRWARMLDELYAMHRILPSCTRTRALSFLKGRAQALFQPYKGNKQIRVLGIQEAEGLSFDRLFVCQLNENAVPRPPANFFIPYRLGQAAQVPGYGIESNGRAERRLIDHLLNAAPIIEFSYAAWVGGEEQLIHPQLRRIESHQAPNPSHTAAAKFTLEEQDDSISPRVTAAEPLRSVVQLIKEQAACPFRSFSRFRLKIEEQPQLIEQLSAQERGEMVHTALHRIWRRLSTQRRLKAMQTDKLRSLITTTIRQLIRDYAKRNMFLRQEIIAEVEQQYLVDLVAQALEYDKSRQPSFRIYALEEKRMLKNFCGYDFSLRIDRIDEIDENGGLMVLDYKTTTGTLSARSLRGEKPDEPQLLVYSLLMPAKLMSIGFFVLSLKRGVKSTGISLGEEKVSDYDSISSQELMGMQQRLKDLFNDFLQGNAEVDPKSSQTCHYCHYQPLCRINASR